MAVNMAMKILLHRTIFSSIKAIYKDETDRVRCTKTKASSPTSTADNSFLTKLNKIWELGIEPKGVGY